MIVMVDIQPETNQHIIALASTTGVPFERVAGAMLDNQAAWVLELERMRHSVVAARPPVYDPLGRGDGYPTGGDA